MKVIWHVGYDGMAMPVSAETKVEAEEKADKHLTDSGYRCSRIIASEASKGYMEWIAAHNIPILD